MKKPIPQTTTEWLEEIRVAVTDGREAAPSGDQIGHSGDDAHLFHLAPVICLKVRGLDYRDETLRQKVTEGALATYIANSDQEGIDHGLERRPLLAFAVCYVAAHYVLDLIDETEAEAVLNFCDEHLE